MLALAAPAELEEVEEPSADVSTDSSALEEVVPLDTDPESSELDGEDEESEESEDEESEEDAPALEEDDSSLDELVEVELDEEEVDDATGARILEALWR